MKKQYVFLPLWALLLFVSCRNRTQSSYIKPAANEASRVVLAYIPSWGTDAPDPACFTHFNYAFAHVADDLKGLRIDNEPRLKEVAALRERKPSLKVLLSVGGWGSSRFSEMAEADTTRRAFAEACRSVIDRLQLDGIDIDWEYPGVEGTGVSASSADTENFTRLLKEIRRAIGPQKLLTIATDAAARYYDLKSIEPYVNFVNIMAYDLEEAPFHHAALFRSEMSGEWSCEEAVNAHVAAGFPVNRLVLGVPFYGHGTHEAPEVLDYRHIVTLDSLQSRWDSIAQVPYMTNAEGTVVISYENAASIASKCRFLHQRGMLGAMCWGYDGDDEKGTLRKALYQGVICP